MVKIIAIGGGENGRPGTKYETKDIDREIVRLSGKKRPHVLFIPPPSPFQEDYFRVMQKVFSRLKCTISPLYLTAPNPSRNYLEERILSSDIIYVGGGNTLKMLKYWKRHGIDKIFRKAAKRDIVLSGLSAGAICWFKFGCSDSRKFANPNAGLIKIKGLDYIPALYCPHYNVELDRKPDLEKLMKITPGIGLAFDNCSAIEIVNNKYRIVTSNAGARAYKVYWKNGKYNQEIIEKKKTFSPLTELLN